MTATEKAKVVQWINGQRSACRRVLENSPGNHAGFRCGVLQGVFLLESLVSGTDEASMGNATPETIQEHLERLKAELRKCPTERAVQADQDRDRARSIEGCRLFSPQSTRNHADQKGEQ